jgi:hypothetical protein
MPDYIYIGDRLTDAELKEKPCSAVRRPDGKCIRGKNGNMLVEFAGVKVVVMARLLRKVNKKTTRKDYMFKK